MMNGGKHMAALHVVFAVGMLSTIGTVAQAEQGASPLVETTEGEVRGRRSP
jgi:hypothetical protein